MDGSIFPGNIHTQIQFCRVPVDIDRDFPAYTSVKTIQIHIGSETPEAILAGRTGSQMDTDFLYFDLQGGTHQVHTSTVSKGIPFHLHS